MGPIPTIEFTTVVGVDREHAEELRLVWPTWKAFRPELLDNPLLLVCDGTVSRERWNCELSFLDHPDRRIERWNMAGTGQREKMLTGLVLMPAAHVETPWYLKIDTDTLADGSSNWLRSEWFLPDERGRRPAFVTNPWGYTKPADAIQRLDDWADTIPELGVHPRLNIRAASGAKRVVHRRIISWCFFGDTEWTRRMASFCHGKLPLPSQDTFLWYCAARRGDFFRTVSMKRYRWRHAARRKALREACARALESR